MCPLRSSLVPQRHYLEAVAEKLWRGTGFLGGQAHNGHDTHLVRTRGVALAPGATGGVGLAPHQPIVIVRVRSLRSAAHPMGVRRPLLSLPLPRLVVRVGALEHVQRV